MEPRVRLQRPSFLTFDSVPSYALPISPWLLLPRQSRLLFLLNQTHFSPFVESHRFDSSCDPVLPSSSLRPSVRVRFLGLIGVVPSTRTLLPNSLDIPTVSVQGFDRFGVTRRPVVLITVLYVSCPSSTMARLDFTTVFYLHLCNVTTVLLSQGPCTLPGLSSSS